jgi:hypothetical protein
MVANLDEIERLVSLTIVVGGVARTYDGLYIFASGSKYTNENLNDCEIKIANLSRETRNAITTQVTPFLQERVEKYAILSAGRASYGLTQIYVGNIISCTVSQPPDIYVTLRCLTGVFQNGNIISRSEPAIARASQIAAKVAQDLGVTLNFQATDKSISNYNYTGPALKQIRKLGEVGAVDAYLDNNTLVVKNSGIPLINRVREVSEATGMIGIPEMTELGVRAKFLLDNYTVLGGAMRITSLLNPSLNGLYVIYKLNFQIANRELPFYWDAEGIRVKS